MTRNEINNFFLSLGWPARVIVDRYHWKVLFRVHPNVIGSVKEEMELCRSPGFEFVYKPLRFFDYWFLRKKLIHWEEK